MMQQRQPPPRQPNNDNDDNPQGRRRRRTGVSFTKLILVAFLGCLALCLQLTVWTLEVLLEERQVQMRKRRKKRKHGSTTTTPPPAGAAAAQTGGGSRSRRHRTTVQSSETTDAAALYLTRTTTTAGVNGGGGTAAVAVAYWNQAVRSWLSAWDPTARTSIVPLAYDDDDDDDADGRQHGTTATGGVSTTLWTPSSLRRRDDDDEAVLHASSGPRVVHALTRAARLGHAGARFHVAAAHAAGFWPLEGHHHDQDDDDSDDPPLTVQESWMVPTSHQQHQALLYWRLAAQQGHVESAMATAHRLEVAQHQQASTATASASDNNNRKTAERAACQAPLPFWEAAAAGVLDQLEADANSRAKVTPATDRHELYLVHLHGGTSSQLEHYNKPDESPDALQFYHLRAVNLHGTDAAAQAAFTLGQYYHHGLRGVAQNVTLAAEYYTMAAEQNHWEAAGQLGKLYLWGIGVPQDAHRAHRFFQTGVPASLYDCQTRYERLIKHTNQKNKAGGDPGVSLCEANCLNGMAMIKLLGVPHVSAISQADAEAFLELARDQGSSEAGYNLAMFKLGWKHHWRIPSAVQDNGQTSIMEEQVLNKMAPTNHLTQAEYQLILSDLRVAASKGHVQANFRLGLLYAHGVTIPRPGSPDNHKITAVPRDCDKATKHFRWVVDHASPDRARRMRRAYRQYAAGDTGDALRNYLAAAATGSETAQLNAAFLLERGECPGLADGVDCAKAAVRLWKAAAERGRAEACLRVGDFYYYGRLQSQPRAVGPFGWTRYLVFPEETVPLATAWAERAQQLYLGDGSQHEQDETETPACEVEGEQGTCAAQQSPSQQDASADEHSVEGDLELAAHYYQLATADRDNARANFNLGFLYEWGLGLKQDFPLAKRHYDLAKSIHSRESDLPVVIALFTLSLHERFVKLYMSWQARWDEWKRGGQTSTGDSTGSAANAEFPAPGPSHTEGTPRASQQDRMDVIMNHIFSWDSLLILLLTVIFFALLRCGATR